MTMPSRFPGHAVTRTLYGWGCTCGAIETPTRALARQAMEWHRIDLWLDNRATVPGDYVILAHDAIGRHIETVPDPQGLLS